ncbi:flagellin lysine-N-methylase [Brevibacillus ginsengisoli]|uniref:flagellin lysine-N-methylase n=1 Tax=Brevibacillus ginsengisoli TaxID=363854 RepID=UPI003CE83401
MAKSNRSVLLPTYMRQFSCIGTECEDNCCNANWTIAIDKKTYNKYRNIKDKKIAEKILSGIKRNKVNSTENFYAQITKSSNNGCSLLNEENLCQIQLQLGAENLSDVCLVYPRHTNIVDGAYELSGEVSCPEVARLALLNKEGIEFENTEEPNNNRHIVIKNVGTNNPNDIKHYLWPLRIFVIQVLQNRSYSLDERLILLGFFYRKINEKISEGKLNEIPSVISSYSEIILDGSLKDNLRSIPSNYEIQVKLLKEITDKFVIGQDVVSSRYYDCFNDFLKGINLQKDSDFNSVINNYQDAYKNYYSPFIKEHEYILENYVVNYVFKDLFPVSFINDVFGDYIVLVINYSLIKLHLIGMAGYHKQLTTDSVIQLIQSLSRLLEHNPLLIKQLYDLIVKSGFSTLPHMAILLKN